MKLIAYQCLDCGTYNITASDGYRCRKCGGHIVTRGEAIIIRTPQSDIQTLPPPKRLNVEYQEKVKIAIAYFLEKNMPIPHELINDYNEANKIRSAPPSAVIAIPIPTDTKGGKRRSK